MREALSRAGAEVTERDFFARPFSEDDLRQLLGDVPPRDVLARRSPSAKRLGVDPDALADDELIRLMVREPRLIRRPLLVVDGRLVVGPNAKAVAGVLES